MGIHPELKWDCAQDYGRRAPIGVVSKNNIETAQTIDYLVLSNLLRYSDVCIGRLICDKDLLRRFQRHTAVNEEKQVIAYKRGFIYLIAIIALVTVLLAAAAGRSPTEILAYLGFTTGISYIFFG